jgi:hypothetical protein
MTTPDPPGGDPAQQTGAGAADGRIRRPEPARAGPRRASVAAAASVGESEAKPSPEPSERKVTDAVAHAVKVGYDVISDNIRQGREAAERFRQGEFSIREAPTEIEAAALRLLHLARELSTTTFDVCERLLKELGAQAQAAASPPAAPRPSPPTTPPPFREPADYPSARKAKSPPTPPKAPADGLNVTVQFAGGQGVAHTSRLTRPRRPTAPAAISATPLAPMVGGGEPISGVNFQADLSLDGLLIVVTLPEGQAPGVYSGLVRAGDDPVPLGALTIEILK